MCRTAVPLVSMRANGGMAKSKDMAQKPFIVVINMWAIGIKTRRVARVPFIGSLESLGKEHLSMAKCTDMASLPTIMVSNGTKDTKTESRSKTMTIEYKIL